LTWQSLKSWPKPEEAQSKPWPIVGNAAIGFPDRNGGSQEATEATRWLLDMREIAKKLPGGAADAHRVR